MQVSAQVITAVRSAIPVNGKKTYHAPILTYASAACLLTVSMWQSLQNAATWNSPGHQINYIYLA